MLTRIELNVVGDLARGNVHLHGIVGVDQGIRVADGATVVCNQERNSLGSQLGLLDLAQLVLQKKQRKCALILRRFISTQLHYHFHLIAL